MITGNSERSHVLPNSNNVMKDSLKDLYSDSKKRIKIILNAVALCQNEDQSFSIPDTTICSNLSHLCIQISESAQLEPNTQYSDAISNIANKMSIILDVNFIENHKNHYPHPIFIVKKGAEILHSFLHRDLRRKQFSSEENEIYQSYLSLIRKLAASSTNEKDF